MSKGLEWPSSPPWLPGRPDEAGWGRLEKDPQWRCCAQPADGAYGDPGRAVRLWLFVTGDGPSPLLVSWKEVASLINQHLWGYVSKEQRLNVQRLHKHLPWSSRVCRVG